MSAKRRLINVMYDLLQEKTIDKISIDMILKRSDVSRSTFYRHFKDKYDLMNWYYQENVTQIFEESANYSWLVTSKKIVTFVSDNKEYFKNAFKAKGANSFYNFLMDYTKNFCVEVYKRNKEVDTISDREMFLFTHYCAGAIYTVNEWLMDKTDIPPDEMSELLCSCIPLELQKYLQ